MRYGEVKLSKQAYDGQAAWAQGRNAQPARPGVSPNGRPIRTGGQGSNLTGAPADIVVLSPQELAAKLRTTPEGPYRKALLAERNRRFQATRPAGFKGSTGSWQEGAGNKLQQGWAAAKGAVQGAFSWDTLENLSWMPQRAVGYAVSKVPQAAGKLVSGTMDFIGGEVIPSIGSVGGLVPGAYQNMRKAYYNSPLAADARRFRQSTAEFSEDLDRQLVQPALAAVTALNPVSWAAGGLSYMGKRRPGESFADYHKRAVMDPSTGVNMPNNQGQAAAVQGIGGLGASAIAGMGVARAMAPINQYWASSPALDTANKTYGVARKTYSVGEALDGQGH